MVAGPANALSGLMCEYGESDEDSDAEGDKQTYHEESKNLISTQVDYFP